MHKLLALAMLFPSLAFATEVGDLPKEKSNAAQEKAFVEFIAPVIEKVNNDMILADAGIIDKYLLDPKSVSDMEIKGLTIAYRLNAEATTPEKLEELRSKVGKIPLGLLVAQASYESDFGRNIAAKKGNNLFNKRCADKGCGIAKTVTSAGIAVELLGYPDIETSIIHQILILNRSQYFKEMRQGRAVAEKLNQPYTFNKSVSSIQEYPHPKVKVTYFKELKKIAERYNLNDLDLKKIK